VRLFPNAHHDGLQPTQLGVVWYLRLHTDTEGPTFISTTARRSPAFVFYIETSQSSSSGHTNALAETTIGLYKTECVREGSPFRHGPITMLADLEQITSAWVHWYNTARLMHRLARRPPVEAEADYHRDRAGAHPRKRP